MYKKIFFIKIILILCVFFLSLPLYSATEQVRGLWVECEGTNSTLSSPKKLQELIAKRAPMDDLKVYAREQDMRMLREEVLELINQGITTVDEGVRILYTVD